MHSGRAVLHTDSIQNGHEYDDLLLLCPRHLNQYLTAAREYGESSRDDTAATKEGREKKDQKRGTRKKCPIF